MSAMMYKNKPYILGLTGGIASGKSTVSAYLKQKGIVLIDSDEIVFNLWKEDETLLNEVEKIFHIRVKTANDKKALAKIIYQDEKKRTYLNQLIHPKVMNKIREERQKHQKESLIVIDMPLLIETNYQTECDGVALVYVTQKLQIERLRKRDHITYREAKQMIKAQMPLKDKKKYATYLLDNQLEKAHLYKQIEQMLEVIYER